MQGTGMSGPVKLGKNERALTVECYTLMQDMAQTFSVMTGTAAYKKDPADLSTVEMLGEMRDLLSALQQRMGPALQTPMIQMLLKRMG